LVAATSLSGCNTAESVKRDVTASLDRPFISAPATPPAAFQNEPEIRVRLLKGISTTRIDGPKQVVVRASTGGRSELVPAPVTISCGTEGFKIVDAKRGIHPWPFGVDLEILSSDAGAGIVTPTLNQSIKIDGSRQPGFASLRGKWSDAPRQFDVIVTMPIETYLPGVLTGELPRDWPRQSYEAQSVAARTYALHERERARRENRPYDVEANTNDQVYTGAGILPIAIEAVRSTRGNVVLSRGGLLRTYFSSTCGGRPASAGQVWPTGIGYEFNKAEPLQGQTRPAACSASKYYRWEVTRNDEELSTRLRLWGRAGKHEVGNITRIRKVEVADRNEAMRPNHYKVSDTSGQEFNLKAEEFRVACNQTGGSLPPITDRNRVLSGDVEVEVWATNVKIRGRGWGHGVGMCQFCARQFALEGKDWAAMMKLFYPGAEVKKLY
jgi:stage II sporulation protein D